MFQIAQRDQCSPPSRRGVSFRHFDLKEHITRAWHQLQRRRRWRATEKLLQGLSDRTLKDIGVHRSEIASLCRDGNQRLHPERWPIVSRYY